MQFTQFSPFSTQSENEVTITPPSSNSENCRQVWSIEDDKMLARAHSTIGQFKMEKWLQGMRPSGASDADLVVRALEEYKQKNGTEKFGYEHVWAIVKDLPSWQPQFVARQISLNTSSTNQTSSGSVADLHRSKNSVLDSLLRFLQFDCILFRFISFIAPCKSPSDLDSEFWIWVDSDDGAIINLDSQIAIGQRTQLTRSHRHFLRRQLWRRRRYAYYEESRAPSASPHPPSGARHRRIPCRDPDATEKIGDDEEGKVERDEKSERLAAGREGPREKIEKKASDKRILQNGPEELRTTLAMIVSWHMRRKKRERDKNLK
nr:uncharacterized protein LOC109179053 [Ipomoea batatas]